jgi:large subunit ribosomal protein L23
MAAIEEKKENNSVKEVLKKSSSKKEEKVIIAENAEIAYKVLVEPWITEKSHAAISDNKYTFKVNGNATKKQVKIAIKGIYGVTVEKIAIVNVHSKRKSYGRYEGAKSGFKKATVTLKKGDRIELFQGA